MKIKFAPPAPICFPLCRNQVILAQPQPDEDGRFRPTPDKSFIIGNFSLVDVQNWEFLNLHLCLPKTHLARKSLKLALLPANRTDHRIPHQSLLYMHRISIMYALDLGGVYRGRA